MNNLKVPNSINSGQWINAADCGASGSEFATTGKITAGSNEITLKDIGDFQVGQEVAASGCCLHYYGTLYNEAEPYLAKNQKVLSDELEFRGLDKDKTWQTFVIHFQKTKPASFNWMVIDPDFQKKRCNHPLYTQAYKWDWQEKELPLNKDWFTLSNGVQARFTKLDWSPGESVSFHARNRLLAKIVAIKDKTLVLSKSANLDATDAVVRHHDQLALQSALEKAATEKKSLFIPSGRYFLDSGLWIKNTSLRIEGADREHTTLDVTEDNTAVFWIAGGKDVAVRNLGMAGHTGFMKLPGNTNFKTASGFTFWPTANQQMEVKGCAAANIVSTEHLLFENLNITGMASEAFYLHGSCRYAKKPFIQAPHENMPELQKQYTKSCIFHRCNVFDCAFNAFNNNDQGENTSILHCHVERIGNFCETGGRFLKIIGNYAKDCHFLSVNGHGRSENPEEIDIGQAIISDNIFEGGAWGYGLNINNPISKVIISNNLFIACSKAPAIGINNRGQRGFPGKATISITGNNIDLSLREQFPDYKRVGIVVQGSNVIIANNHIYDHGNEVKKTTGISISNDSTNIHVHDNIINNCYNGIRNGSRTYIDGINGNGDFKFLHSESEVEEALGTDSFEDKLLLYLSCYQGWKLRWLTGHNAGKVSIIKSFDHQTRTLKLGEKLEMQAGDRFEVCPEFSNWQIHNNTIENCIKPLKVDMFSPEGIFLKDNVIIPTKE
jgi:hypothetical protein